MLERIELEAFLTLAEELHFGRTAERLGVTTGRISQTVKKLERRVGTPLFDRTSRSVHLTDVGRRLYEDLRPARELIDTALARAAAAARGPATTLRVGFSTPWGGERVARAAEAFRRHDAAADCAIDIQEVQLDGAFRPLLEGELDLQLAAFPVREPGLTTGPVLWSEPRVLLVPAGHPLATRTAVSLEDLADVPLVTASGPHPAYWLDAHFPRRTPSGRPIPRGPVAASWQEVLSHVGAGRGVATGAARGAEYHPRPGVVYVPFDDAPPLAYGLVWRTAADGAELRAFVRTVHTTT
ncbi:MULTISPECIES: LysR family transcriptional regulator [Streptomyces]|uniref:LysR family transcriptional regulator n=1 Tax=Streptomyces solicathayae TaxID=3081768 RepID=A0ABZ0M387_9ACTN|nr:LysR family transcriptional regulator [Streptomyces sp. HUAS YS2]WOX26243.1 LysR family transcriptional regulator [Streptomyces sp. HUAS YS2]